MRVLFATVLLSVAPASAFTSTATAQVNWGSFDGSRINYAAGQLTGSAHNTLRSIIEANDGDIVLPTASLTAEYLSGVDVFYTSLLSTSTGTLSGPEQTALQNWIADGGTLIVTADIFPLAAYESFTAAYGVTGYTVLGHLGTGFVVAQHMITENVTSYSYGTESTYTFGLDALLLGNNGLDANFMIVMEPSTGFNVGGRLLVFGDHNMFTDTYIGELDNAVLAANMAAWAAIPVPGTLVLLGLAGFMGTRGRRR